MPDVLLTCAGRRNYLVHCFREALRGRGDVIAADASATAPALHEADVAIVVPPISDPGYIDAILGICQERDVGVLFSLNDLELPLLARNRERFAEVGTIAVVSSPEVINVCFDKLATAGFLKHHGFDSPLTYATLSSALQAVDEGVLGFPLVVKPRWGTASIGTEYPESVEELELVWKLGKTRLMRGLLADISATDQERCLLVQERVNGTEYNIDVLNDLEGRHVKTFVKRKLASRIGEGAVDAVTVAHPRLEEFGRALGETLEHVGLLDCDVFVDGESVNVVDLNPRFGGSYPFIHHAGVDVPATLMAWASGERHDPAWLDMRPGVQSAKCDRLSSIRPMAAL